MIALLAKITITGKNGEKIVNEKLAVCLYCQHSSDEVPLLRLEYRGSQTWICPQHLPILIHKPSQLAGKLPGAENFPTSGEDHGHSHG